MLATKNKKKSKNEKEIIPAERIRMMEGVIDESEISAKERAEAWQLEAMLQLLNYPEDEEEEEEEDVPTNDENSDDSQTKDQNSAAITTNYKKSGEDQTKDEQSGDIETKDEKPCDIETKYKKYDYAPRLGESSLEEEEELIDCGVFPGKIKIAVRPKFKAGVDCFFDKQRVKAEELELRLLEHNDYEARLDDDFFGEGNVSSSGAGYKTTALSFYNADEPKVDQRVLAEDLDFKLINDHEKCLNGDFTSKGEVEIPSRYDKSAPTYAALDSAEMNDRHMSEMADDDRIECPYYQPKEPDVFGLEGDEFEEMSADSSIVFSLFRD